MVKKLFLIGFVFLILGCRSNETVIVSKLPKGLDFEKKEEKYNPYNGQYILSYTVTNQTDSNFQYGSINALAYIDGKLDATIAGNISQSEYLNKGKIGEAEISWLFPNKRPDSIVINLVY